MANSKLKCKYKPCGEYYRPDPDQPPWVVWCSPECGAGLAMARNKKNQENQRKAAERLQKKQAKQERSITRQKKKELMTRTEWYARYQTLVNQYVVHVRDVGKPCCTCGTENPNIKYDCGHCFTVAARPDIRFDLFNMHKQCSVQCNQHGSGMRHEYKLFIVETYGPLELMRLERVGLPLKIQFSHWEDIESEITRYRAILRDNGIKPNV